jgi:hypothetical protein
MRNYTNDFHLLTASPISKRPLNFFVRIFTIFSENKTAEILKVQVGGAYSNHFGLKG